LYCDLCDVGRLQCYVHFEVSSTTRQRAERFLETILPGTQHRVHKVLIVIHCREVDEKCLAIHGVQLFLQSTKLGASEVPFSGGEVLENFEAILNLVLHAYHAGEQSTNYF
jgi:hypothetical protein